MHVLSYPEIHVEAEENPAARQVSKWPAILQGEAMIEYPGENVLEYPTASRKCDSHLNILQQAENRTGD